MIKDFNISLKSSRFQAGFTLVELLVVIALIAILGVVAIAAINPAAKIQSATDARAVANVQALGKAFEACIADEMSDTTNPISAAVATNSCCGAAAAGACVSTGLSTNNYGYATGFPTGVTVTRGPAAGTAICISQAMGTGTAPNNNTKYVVGGGTITKLTAVCSAVSGT
ncbi:MAG: type II secretion system protein [candidate division WWE3 bacterium]|nr:type II secretion system protein [candidate division WWE3 bacterium]